MIQLLIISNISSSKVWRLLEGTETNFSRNWRYNSKHQGMAVETENKRLITRKKTLRFKFELTGTEDKIFLNVKLWQGRRYARNIY